MGGGLSTKAVPEALKLARTRLICHTVNNIFGNSQFAIAEAFNFPSLICIHHQARAPCFRCVPDAGMPIHHNMCLTCVARLFGDVCDLECMLLVKKDIDDLIKNDPILQKIDKEIGDLNKIYPFY